MQKRKKNEWFTWPRAERRGYHGVQGESGQVVGLVGFLIKLNMYVDYVCL